MNCSKCGAELDKTLRFCTLCGSGTGPPRTRTQPDTPVAKSAQKSFEAHLDFEEQSDDALSEDVTRETAIEDLEEALGEASRVEGAVEEDKVEAPAVPQPMSGAPPASAEDATESGGIAQRFVSRIAALFKSSKR